MLRAAKKASAYKPSFEQFRVEKGLPPLPPKKIIEPTKWLSFMGCIQLLIEAIAYNRGPRAHWLSLFFVELIKSFLRLVILFRNKGHMITCQGIPEKELVWMDQYMHILNEQASKTRPTLLSKHKFKFPVEYTTKDEIHEEKKSIASLKMIFGEFLWIIRPLVYLLVQRRFGDRSWAPWIASFAVDISSQYLTKDEAPSFSMEKSLERDRRYRLWLLYLLRSPCFELLFSKYVSMFQYFI
jgi:peroxin-16